MGLSPCLVCTGLNELTPAVVLQHYMCLCPQQRESMDAVSVWLICCWNLVAPFMCTGKAASFSSGGVWSFLPLHNSHASLLLLVAEKILMHHTPCWCFSSTEVRPQQSSLPARCSPKTNPWTLDWELWVLSQHLACDVKGTIVLELKVKP